MTAVPVIMYHSIGIPNKSWRFNHLTCPYTLFENQLKWLKKRGFKTISLKELYNHMSKNSKLPKNPIVLTFDDGYLDNWVFAYPLLKKYGQKGTIYVNPEFVNPKPIIRKNLEDYWNDNVKFDDLEISGFLSWHELRQMEKEGQFDIQSHSMTHTWYPKGERIIDFRHPDDSYIWMTWNNNISKKPYLQVDSDTHIDFGAPVYENGRSIGIKRFQPDVGLNNYIISYVKEKGGEEYFESSNWKNELYEITKKFKEKNILKCAYETENEYTARINFELKNSKNIIEKNLNKKVEFLCWPGGSVSEDAIKIASDLGYLSSTVGRDIKDRKNLKNVYGENPSRINRFGTILYWNGIEGVGSKIKHQNGFLLVLSLYRFQGSYLSPLSFIILNSAALFYKIYAGLISVK